ncbi:MAG: hypothetical protein KDD62_03800, partial [Bdellovibrionales bacterium]|nr:hypothetical protein [Bdellovibrionales bacterium]
SSVLECPPRVEVYGTGGYFICEDTLGRHGGGRIYSSVSGEMKYRIENPFKVQVERFRNLIKGEDQGMVLGDEGLENVRILLEAVG